MLSILSLFAFIILFAMGLLTWEAKARGYWVWIVLSIPFLLIYGGSINS